LHCIEAGHSFVDMSAGSSAQRIRIGLTGLAFAFLLVLLGSVISRSGRDDAARQAEQNAANAAEPNEPLAELGVAPGATTNNSSDSK
jgi:hypothetical protein